MSFLSKLFGGGQSQPKQPHIAKDDLASISTAKILYGLSEGEIYGLADGAKSIKLDETPIINDDGQPNFTDSDGNLGVKWSFRTGKNEQDYIKGFPDVSNEKPVGTDLRHATPFVRAISDTQLSAVSIRLAWSALREQKTDGDIVGTTVEYKIEIKAGSAAYKTVLDTQVNAKTSNQYERSHRFNLPESDGGWLIKVTRITPDSTSDLLSNAMRVESITEIIDVKLSYPNTAMLGLEYDARTFSSIAKLSLDCMGKLIQVPSNYNAETREYIGIWDGTFKTAYSNNPAWVYHDLLLARRYGLGKRLDASMIDKWSLYQIAQYCDEMVDDGKGGLEPRFTVNVYLQSHDDAFTVLQSLTAIFRGIVYWSGEKIVAAMDAPSKPIFTFTRANVVGGAFAYIGTRARDRHTVAKVAWDNPANDYKTEYEWVRDERAIATHGVKTIDINMMGCTSAGQAQRAGLAALTTEQLENRQVSFSIGLDGMLDRIKPSAIISVSDEIFAGRANGGRISKVSASKRVITLDREVTADVGDVLCINNLNGLSERRAITAINGRDVTVVAPFDSPSSEHAWAIDSENLRLMLFRIMSITQGDDNTYAINAIQHEPQKYAAIDEGAHVVPPIISIVEPDIINPPEFVNITQSNKVAQGINITTMTIGWAQVKEAVAYDVEWKKDGGTWINLPRTSSLSIDVEGVYSGQYLARVRAVSAFDVLSREKSSVLTAIVGKQGLPPTIVGLKATGVLFGIELKWGFANGSGDAAYTEIQTASAPNTNVSLLGQYSYPTNSHAITGLQGNLSQSYRARLIDKLGFTSAWSAWVTGTTDASADKIMDLIQGQIDESALDGILKEKIANIEINKGAISDEVQNRIDYILAANNRITDEADDRIEALRLASKRTDGLQDFADDLADSVNTVTLAQTKTANGLAVVKTLAETLEIESGVQAQSLTYLSSEISFGYADKTKYANKARSTVWTFAKTVAHADYTNAQMIRGLSADYQDSSARFTEKIELNASKSEAVATKTTNLSAQLVGGYDGNDLTKVTSGLVFEESKARATDVEGLAEQMSLLSAGVGEQFDSFDIWHFNKDKEGWVNGTYSNGWINVRTDTITSPAIVDLDGAVYKHIKLRVKKVGTPTWLGRLTYTGGSLTVGDPSYDEDGIALVNWQADWVGDITSFSLKLASAADNLNYYSIDWIAIGRPSPAASNAALLRESSVRASETSANASDLVKLTSKIEGGNGVPIESSITKKLETTADLASTTARDFSELKSDYDDDMYGYEGTVQTTARTLAGATQAEAERLDLLSANILPSYADKTQYANSSRSKQWTYAKTVAADNYAANQRITNLQSDFDNSNADFSNELLTLAQKDKSIVANITQLYAETNENYGLIQDIDIAISTPTSGLAAKITELQSSSSDNAGAADAAQRAANDAATAADEANNKLLPANIASLVEGSGAFSDEFGAISGKFSTMEGVVEGQKTAIEVVSAVGNAEKLKNEIAKARLDKDVTHLQAQSVALTDAIASYGTKITDLNAKRNKPKDPKITQSEYVALRAEYAKQIMDVTVTRVDMIAQKAVITDQVAQLVAEKKVLDSLVITERDVKAQHTIKIDAGGKIAGFGLVVDKSNFSDFSIRADKFYIAPPENGVNKTDSPFMVLTTPTNIKGVTVPSGTYIQSAFIHKASIDTAQIADAAIKTAQIDKLAVKEGNIANLAVTTGKIANLSVDTLQIAGNAVTIPRLVFVPTVPRRTDSNIRKEFQLAETTMSIPNGSAAISIGFDNINLSTIYGPNITIIIKRNNVSIKEYELTATGSRTSGNFNIREIQHDYLILPTFLDTVGGNNTKYSLHATSLANSTNISYDVYLDITGVSFYVNGVKK